MLKAGRRAGLEGLRQTSHSAGHWRFLPSFFFCGCWCKFFFNAPYRYAAPRMSRAAVTLDTVEIAGPLLIDIADDQRLFTPLAQVTPMTCMRKKAVFACLDTNVTFTSIYNSLRPVLRLRRDVEQASWRGQSRPRKRRHTESADCPHIRRYLKPTVTPLPPILNEFSLQAKCEFMIRSLSC